MNAKISVIVPIYKVEPYIRKCVESICSQTCTELEILLVDDGSPDGCGKICDEYASGDPRIKVFHISNSGQSHARNVGLHAASGEYIGFVDGDVWISSDMYEKLLSCAVSQGAEIVECNFQGRKEKLPDRMEDGQKLVMSGREAITRHLDARKASRYPSTSVWSKLFKREVIADLGFPDGRIHEEYAFLCEAFLNTEKYVYLNECLYNRTLRSDSTTAEKFSRRTLDKIYVFQLRNRLLEERGEKELLALARQREYGLLLWSAVRAHNAGMDRERREIEDMIDARRSEIRRSGMPLKKKLQYGVYFVSKKLYYRLRKG